MPTNPPWASLSDLQALQALDGLLQISGADVTVEFAAHRDGDCFGKPMDHRLGQPVARLPHQFDVQVTGSVFWSV